jgi:hypothetical protein
LLDEAAQERYQLAFGKGEKRAERRFAANDRSEGVGAQPNWSAGHLPRHSKFAVVGQLRRVSILEWISDLMDWKSKKLGYKGGRQIPNRSLKEENEYVR